MRCWCCDDREEVNELGLCRLCDEQLHDTETLIPPGSTLFPKGTLPEEVGPYRTPGPEAYRTTPY